MTENINNSTPPALGIEAHPLTMNDLTDSELQWYAGELRRCCGDDVACEELSAIAVDVYLYIS